MAEVLLANKTMLEIDKHIFRILNELGNPAPPLSHEQVRSLLRLDMAYFQQNSPGFFDELFSRVKRTAKNLISDPSRVIQSILNKDIRAAYLPEEKKFM